MCQLTYDLLIPYYYIFDIYILECQRRLCRCLDWCHHYR